MLSTEYNEKVAELASPRQLEYYKKRCELGSNRKVAEHFGTNRRVVDNSMKSLESKAAKLHVIPNWTADCGVAEGYKIKGTSTLHDKKTGEDRLVWVKTCEDAVQTEQRIMEMVAELCEPIKGKSQLIPAPRYTTDNLMSMYGFFDRHVGMMCWQDETSDSNYDLRLCAELESEVIRSLVASQPCSEKALIVFGGDFFHADDDQQVTPAHKNKLDVDGRASKVFKTGVMVAINAVLEALKKHKTVRIEVIPGNHDPVSSDHLMYVLWAYFNNNDRVEVIESHGEFAYCRHGTTLLAFHHGHKAKPNDMYRVITTDRRGDWSEVDFVDAYTGHFHSESVSNIGIVRFETLTTPIPNDAHSASKYRSRRCAHAITYDKVAGMIGRTVHNIAPMDSSK